MVELMTSSGATVRDKEHVYAYLNHLADRLDSGEVERITVMTRGGDTVTLSHIHEVPAAAMVGVETKNQKINRLNRLKP